MKLLVACLLLLGCWAYADVVSPEEGELWEGDMALTPQQSEDIQRSIKKHQHHGFAAIRTGLWLKNGKAETIEYYIDPLVAGATKKIYAAVAEYHKKTCIRFVRVISKPSGPHIHFTTGTGCSSPVGKQYRGNTIHLARGCWHSGTIQHEMGHSVGFFHEQSRTDRDKYVEILWHNIKQGHGHNFNRYGTKVLDSRGFKYDLDSMMHYGGNFFSVDPRHKLTIRTLDPKMQKRIGQRKGMSVGDADQLNAMYFCK